YRRGAAEQAKIMEAAGADLIMLEMMVDVAKMQALLDGVAETELPVWVGLSCAPDAEGRMCLQAGDADETGTVVAQEGAFLVDAVRALCGTSVPLISIMHTDVEHVDACLDVLDAEWAGLKGVYAHSGRFVDGGWVFEGTITPEAYGAASERWLARGVNLIGGCCGIRPDHIEVLGAKMTAAE
ncbi:MAG: homocysteine S-methyltransferase family protein, partial [Pseudomonadota bacterium]